MVDFRQGRYQDVLTDVTCEALILDAPYSDRTHAGHFSGTSAAAPDADWLARKGYDDKKSRRAPLKYPSFSAEDVQELVKFFAPRCRGWMVSITDHVLAPAWEQAFRDAERYTFAPLPFVEIGKQPRLTGDGPASWSCFIVVSRPKTREFASWGSLPGAYCTENKDQSPDRITGGKPLWLMRRLVEDYSRPGDRVCDPCAGGATTLVAARQLGRVAIGAECDATTYAKAKARLDRAYVPDMFSAQTKAAPAFLDLDTP